MSVTTSSKVREAVKAQISSVRLCEIKIRAFHLSIYGLQEKPYVADSIREHANAILCELYRDLNDAFRRVLSLSTLGWEDEDLRQEIAQMTYDRFLSEVKEIMHFLSPAGKLPHKYQTSERDELRKQLDELAKLVGVQVPPKKEE